MSVFLAAVTCNTSLSIGEEYERVRGVSVLPVRLSGTVAVTQVEDFRDRPRDRVTRQEVIEMALPAFVNI